MSKKQITMQDFKALVIEGVQQIQRRGVLESEKTELESELKEINECFNVDDESVETEISEDFESYSDEELSEDLDEGLFGPSKGEKEANRQALDQQISAILDELSKYPNLVVMGSKESILKKAAESNFKGKPWRKQVKGTNKVVLGFTPELSMMQKLASGTGSQTVGT